MSKKIRTEKIAGVRKKRVFSPLSPSYAPYMTISIIVQFLKKDAHPVIFLFVRIIIPSFTGFTFFSLPYRVVFLFLAYVEQNTNAVPVSESKKKI
jgi:hypothetical protein